MIAPDRASRLWYWLGLLDGEVLMGTTRYTTVNGRIISQTKNGVYTRFLFNPLGSVIATVNSAGAVSNRTTYWPNGEVRTGGVSAVTNMGFCGAWAITPTPQPGCMSGPDIIGPCWAGGRRLIRFGPPCQLTNTPKRG